MAVRVLDKLNPNFAWDGRRVLDERDVSPGRAFTHDLRGPLGAATSAGGRWRVVRDPLGINKLFWAATDDEGLLLAARPRTLVDHGVAFADVRAVPRGCVADLSSSGQVQAMESILPAGWRRAETSARNPGAVAARIAASLHAYLSSLAERFPDATVFVCLSGGLDSTGIASLAREHFRDVVAVSFDLDRGSGRVSDDRAVGKRVARDLGLGWLEANVTPDVLLAPIDDVLVEGIDWRDFNVHAALVNMALALAIEGAVTEVERGVLVLTGDMANEFLVDYETEWHRGTAYYTTPRVNPVAMRSALLRGLDTSHREVGIFASRNLPVIQPYAVAVDAYMALPPTFLAMPDRKQRLCRSVFGNAIPGYVYTRPKVRAQMGDAQGDGGVLGVCVDRGLDGDRLKRRFAELHGVSAAELDTFIRAGSYRAAVPSMEVQRA